MAPDKRCGQKRKPGSLSGRNEVDHEKMESITGGRARICTRADSGTASEGRFG